MNQLSNPPFAATEIKEHRLGLVANQTIMRGERLMSFTPGFMTSEDTYADLAQDDRLRLQRLALQQLPNRLRNSSQSLFGQGGDEINDSIVFTNSFSLLIATGHGNHQGESSETLYRSLFPETAMDVPTSRSCRTLG